MGYWSPEARAAYRKRNAQRIRDTAKAYRINYPEKRKETEKKSRAKLDDAVYAAKDKACIDCGLRFPLCAMQFDHVRGEKVAYVAVLRSRGNLSKLLTEIEKCDVVCANCHAVRTCLRDTREKARRCEHGPVCV